MIDSPLNKYNRFASLYLTVIQMATTKEMVLEAACKSGIDILDELMGTEIEERSRFEGKALSPAFLVRLM